MNWTYYGTFEIDADQMWRIWAAAGVAVLDSFVIGFLIGKWRVSRYQK